jgi:Amt family ammonium transporter
MCAAFAFALLPFSFVCALDGDLHVKRAIVFHLLAQGGAWACCGLAKTEWGKRHASPLLFALLSVVNAAALLAGVQTLSGANPIRDLGLLSPLIVASLAPWRPMFSLALAAEMTVVYLLGTRLAPDPTSPSLLAALGMLAFSGIAGALACQSHRRVWASLNLARGSADAARNAALAADRAKSEFLANMSHEIRTPLTAILGFTDELLDEAARSGDQEPDPALLTVRRNGQHLLAVVNDILDLSRIEAGKLSVQGVPTAPRRVVSDVVALLRPRASETQLRLDVRFRGPVPESIRSDPTRLHQILVNLTGNAIKFTEHGGITLRLEHLPAGPDRAEPLLAIDVVDTGVGLNDDEQVRIFEAFAQADASLTRRHGGTGLGLTISRALARLLGGDVTVESATGRGSTFRATFATGPLEGVRMVETDALAETRAPAPKLAADPVAPLNARVLLAEDGPDNQALISLVLRRGGLSVEIASDGQSALEQVLAARDQGEPFDLIVMDMQMPLMTGYEATAALRRAGVTSPILALTAQAMTGDREKCLAAGCDEYLSKPIDRARLMTLARELLEKRPEDGDPA